MDRCEEWLLAWFQKKGDLPEGFKNLNYFELGLIDSFGVIELISDVEKEFCMTFNEENFQDRRFASVSGLAEIVNEHLVKS